MNTQTRFESSKEFKPIWKSLPKGTKAWKVKIFDDTGNCVAIEYTIDQTDLQEMREVSDGYFYEIWIIKK